MWMHPCEPSVLYWSLPYGKCCQDESWKPNSGASNGIQYFTSYVAPVLSVSTVSRLRPWTWYLPVGVSVYWPDMPLVIAFEYTVRFFSHSHMCCADSFTRTSCAAWFVRQWFGGLGIATSAAGGDVDGAAVEGASVDGATVEGGVTGGVLRWGAPAEPHPVSRTAARAAAPNRAVLVAVIATHLRRDPRRSGCLALEVRPVRSTRADVARGRSGRVVAWTSPSSRPRCGRTCRTR